MCGITGFLFSGQKYSSEEAVNICKTMTDRIVHRGPDDSGAWHDVRAGVVLGQRRLSIIDLSAQGHQPMASHDNRYVMVLNGEIYNYIELRNKLEQQGFQFRGTSDTEVAVCAMQAWGVKSALQRFVGMFALGVWDNETENLFLARDRMGEKPLYYGIFNKIFGFASELKALTVHPDWQGEIDPDSLAMQFEYTYIPTPHCIYKGIYKLLPGTFLTVSRKSGYSIATPEPYWSFDSIVLANAKSRKQTSNPETVVNELHSLLLDTISDKMIADVPLGAFLSGGIDSSLVVALMQAQSSQPVKTFSIGFNEREYNEAEYAKQVARHLGTDHTELYVTPHDSMDVIPRLPYMYDEPYSDSSQIPTFLVSQLARQDVTVALSGDGGDELFGGYDRYLIGLNTWNKLQRIPAPLRKAAGYLIHRIPPGYIEMLVNPIRPVLPRSIRYKQFGQKLHKLARVWNTTSPDTIYKSLISLWQDPQSVVLGSSRRDLLGIHRGTFEQLENFTERMMYTDTLTYMPDDILVKVDRASMAVSLEVRVPFLDHRIVEFAWQQPPDLKIRNNQSKWLLRQILKNYVPDTLIDRPKMGFAVPLDHWLRGPLKEWAGDLLSESRLRQQGILNPQPVQAKWQEHLSGEVNWQYVLWPVLMFQAWHDHWLKS